MDAVLGTRSSLVGVKPASCLPGVWGSPGLSLPAGRQPHRHRALPSAHACGLTALPAQGTGRPHGAWEPGRWLPGRCEHRPPPHLCHPPLNSLGDETDV